MPPLIIGTLSTLETTWGKEIFSNFLTTRTFEILHGSHGRRLALLQKDVDFYIINHDGVGVGAHTRKRLELDGFAKELAGRSDIKIVIGDEASAWKDAQTKRNRLARLIFANRPYFWPMTGSPTPTAPTDSTGSPSLSITLLENRSRRSKRKRCIKSAGFAGASEGWLRQSSAVVVAGNPHPIDQVWDGPKLTTEMREVPLTDQQKKLMADLKKDLQVVVKSGHPISAVNEASARQKFLQISMGGIYDANHKSHAVDAGPRYAELERVIEETTRKSWSFRP